MKKKIIIEFADPDLSLPAHLQKPGNASMQVEGLNDLETVQMLLSATVGAFTQYKNKVDELSRNMKGIPGAQRDIN